MGEGSDGNYQLFPALSEEDFDALVEDVRVRGVLVPLEYDEHGNLLDGHHRLRAVQQLGLTSYPRVIRAGLSEDQKRLHVRALNLFRRHLTRQQRAEQIAELRKFGWSTRRIAASAGVSDATVRRDLRAAGAPQPDLIVGADGKEYSARRRTPAIVARTASEQQRAQAALQVLDQPPARLIDLRRAERLVREQQRHQVRSPPRTPTNPDQRVLHSDFRELPVQDASARLIMTDPPYRKRDMPLWEDLAHFAERTLRPDGMLLAYCGQMHLPEAMAALSTRLNFWWCYASVHDGTTAQVRQRAIGCGWTPVLAFRPRTATDALPPFSLDVARGTRSKQHHPFQQSVNEAQQWIASLTEPADLVVDPFIGSGTSAIAAQREGRSFIGGDVDAQCVLTAVQRLAAEAEAKPDKDRR